MRLDKRVIRHRTWEEGGYSTSRGGEKGRKSSSLNQSVGCPGYLDRSRGSGQRIWLACMQLFSFPYRFFRLGNHSC